MHLSIHKYLRVPALAAPIIAALGPLPALAEQAPSGFTIGVLGVATTSPYDADTEESSFLPDLDYTRNRFSIGITGASYDVFDSENVVLSARLAPRFFSDPGDVAGLEHLKRETAAEAGLAGTVRFGPVSTSLEILTDISGIHEGTAIEATVGTAFSPTPRLGIAVQAGATWMDNNLATYSFGIRSDEATEMLAAYRIEDTVVPSLGVLSRYALTDRVSLIGGLSVEFLPDRVTDSPIINREVLTSGMIGLRYGF